MSGAFVSVAAFCLGTLLCFEMHAQSISIPAGAKGPQARTADELDAFGLLYEAHSTTESAASAEAFLRVYPKSEFVEYAAAAAMHSYHEIGNWQRSKELTRMVLEANPENVDALLHLARLLIDPGHEEKANLGEARRLAERGLSKLKSMTIPQSAKSQEWLRTRKSFLAAGTSVLGWISFREGETERALEYLKQAAASDGQGEYFYRLSLITASKQDLPGSRQWASQALQAGPEWIRVLARRQVETLDQRSYEQR